MKLSMSLDETFFEELKRRRLKGARFIIQKKGNETGVLFSYRWVLSAVDVRADPDKLLIRAERQFYFGPAGAENEGDPFHENYKKAADSVQKWMGEMKVKYGVEVLPGEWVE